MSIDQKILVIRFSSIGDIVLATSPLKTIRQKFPNAQITFLTLDTFAPLFEFHPHIDALIGIDKNKSLRGLWDFSHYINQQRYHHIFDLHNSLRSNLVTLWNSGPISQVEKPRWKRFMLFQFHENQFSENFSTRFMYHQYLGENIWREGDPIPDTFLSVSDREKSLADELVKSKGLGNHYLTIVPGAAWRQKQWSVDKYIDFLQQVDKPVILLGAMKDKVCFQIKEKIPTVLNLAGKTSLRQALAVLSNSMHVIGSDTGLVHAAEALGVPVTMILGPTSVETGAGVLLDGSSTIEKDLWCRPCSQNGNRPCYRKSQVCMDNIHVDDLLNSIPETLS